MSSKRKGKNKPSNDLVVEEVSSPHKVTEKLNLRGIIVSAKSEGQKRAIQTIKDHQISVLYGYPGSGKSFLSVGIGLQMLMQDKIEKLIFTRPYVEAGESLGFLPGTYNSKIAPFMYPVMEIAGQFIGSEAVSAFIDKGNIRVIPLAYMRGMAQPLESIIYTPTGPTKMGDLKVGDNVIGIDGKPTKITGVFPQGKKKVYKITFSDGFSTECCDDHLWSTKTLSEKRHGKDFSVKKTSEIRSSLKTKWGQKNHEIPLISNPVEFEETPTEIDPYLLGLLLGDGSLNNKASITFTTNDTELLEYIKNSLPEHMKIVHASNYDYRLIYDKNSGVGNPLRKSLKKLNLLGKFSENKFIPDCYKYNSKETRLEILRGLLDTDGSIFKHKSKKYRVQYYSISEKLAKDVVFIVQSLGGIAHLKLKKCNNRITYINNHKVENKHDIWVVDIVLGQNINPFKLTRKNIKYNSCRPKRLISSIEEIGEKDCQCISVEHEQHLYLTDNFIVTHNTFQNTFVVADEMQNSSPTQMRLLLTRLGDKSQLVITGDTEQSDLHLKTNGLVDCINRLKDVPEIGFCELGEECCVRSPLVAKIDKIYRGK